MAKIKDLHLEFINDMNQMVDVEYQFEEYRNSEKYVEDVNHVLAETKPIYSSIDVENALHYAFDSVIIEAEEIGTEVYGKLIHEKVVEYLNTTH